MKRSLRTVGGRGRARARAPRAHVGQLLDSPTGRITRAQEIDAAFTQLWRDQYTRHVPEQLRAAFEADYKAWQQTKEGMAAMSVASLILPATGELLDRWANKAAEWSAQFRRVGVEPSAPALERPPERRFAEQAGRIVWGLAAGLGAIAVIYTLSRLPQRKLVPA